MARVAIDGGLAALARVLKGQDTLSSSVQSRLGAALLADQVCCSGEGGALLADQVGQPF